MALARTRRSETGMNYWPGFVDALSTLILGIIFLLTVFVVVQFYLQQEVAGKDTALQQLNAQIAQLTSCCRWRRPARPIWKTSSPQLRATLATAESDRDKYKGQADSAGAGAAAAQGKVDDAHQPARGREEALRQGAGAGRDAQPADRRAAPPARGDRDRARRLRAEGQGIAEPRSPISASGSMWRWRRRCRS